MDLFFTRHSAKFSETLNQGKRFSRATILGLGAMWRSPDFGQSACKLNCDFFKNLIVNLGCILSLSTKVWDEKKSLGLNLAMHEFF